MHYQNPTSGVLLLVPLLLACAVNQRAFAQAALPEYQPLKGELSSQDGAWEYWRVDGSMVALRVLSLVPQAEPKPALSVQLIPDDFHQKDGNAAVFYLQAMGFFEQTYALQAKTEFERKNREAATAADKPSDEVPPHSWRATRPEDLPIEQVKEYLKYTSFQPRYLQESVQRRRCDFDRHIRDVDNPVMYLLPEVQAMRELARTQSLRFLLAIAEDRTDDAVAILGQQLAMGMHLAQEPFLVSNLVGIACAGIGWNDSFYLCEHKDAPNLYWAIAALPQPLVDMRPALSYEREFLFEQVKLLRDVDETPRSNLYWTRFVDDFVESTEGLDDPLMKYGKPGFVMAIAAGVPGAKKFLVEVEGMTIEQLELLPNTQVFFLAVRRFYERTRDETFKWSYMPQWERDKHSRKFEQEFSAGIENFGFIANPSGLVLPALQAALTAQTRLAQQLAFLQTIEAIRHQLATNRGQLPNTLSELSLPMPLDPATGKTFDYVRHAQGATISGGQFPGIKYQFEIRVDK